MEFIVAQNLGIYGAKRVETFAGYTCVYTVAFPRGGLGWGKTLVNQLFQTCMYTVALFLGWASLGLKSNQADKSIRSEHKPIRSEHKPIRSEHKPIRSEHKPIRSEHKPIRPEHKPIRPEHKPIRSEHKFFLM
jgi:hypothetical protein